MVLRVTWCYIHLQLSASSFICPILSTSQGRLIDRGGHMWLPLAGNMCDPHATIRKVSITRSRPRCWPSVTRSTLKILDHLIAFVTFSMYYKKILPKLVCGQCSCFQANTPWGASPAPSGPPPPKMGTPLPPSPSSPFVNISKYAAKHSTWAQSVAPLTISWLIIFSCSVPGQKRFVCTRL